MTQVYALDADGIEPDADEVPDGERDLEDDDDARFEREREDKAWPDTTGR